MALRAKKPAMHPSLAGPAEQVVVLRGIPWEVYTALGEALGDASAPRMAYLDGVLEIMSPGRPHEYWKKMIARLIEGWALETGVPVNGFGSETQKEEAKRAGIEPDECYIVGDAKEKQRPDLAIEVVYSHGGIKKLEIYHRLGVREVWYWKDDRIQVYQLTKNGYRVVKKSRVLSDIDVDEIAAIVRESDPLRQTETVRAYQRALRSRRARH